MSALLSAEAAQAVAAAWRAAPAVVMDELKVAMDSALLYVQGQAAERTPTDLGTLRNAFTTGSSLDGHALHGWVSNPLAYATPVELGTKPHYPPLQPLMAWAERHPDFLAHFTTTDAAGNSWQDVEAAARAIQRKIGRFGSAGHGMLHFAVLDGEGTIRAEFEAAAGRIAARLAPAAGGLA